MTSRERLALKLRPVYLALGEVMSTNTGKMLFVMAYDAGECYEWARERAIESEGKRPTKRHERDGAGREHWLGKRLTFVTALTAMVYERCGFVVGMDTIRRVINTELSEMHDRDDAQSVSAPIGNLVPQHM